MSQRTVARGLGAVFSDIDGTLVHYQKKLEAELGYQYLGEADPPRVHADSNQPIHEFLHRESGRRVDVVAVPSATLGGGYCSVETLRLAAELRARGVLFVVITGARTSTFRDRVASRTIPLSDYNVCEGGGRIWDANDRHDDAWTDRLTAVCGPWRDQLDLPPNEKAGPLWDVYRLLERPDALGPGTGTLKLDGKSFSTAFMADVRADTTRDPTLGVATVSASEAALRKLSAEVFAPQFQTDMVVNLGKAHFAPAGLDKRAAVQYISTKEGIALRGQGDVENQEAAGRFAAALFDDENDLGFASVCAMGFAPSIAHPSVVPALETLGPNFTRTPVDGFLGTEFALQQLLQSIAVAEGS